MSSLKTFVFGLLVGVALTAGGFLIFGDTVRAHLSSTTRDVGHSVEKAGEKLQEAGEHLK